MVYSDGVHLTADSLEELYNYAQKLRLNSELIEFMGRNIHPHFKIFGYVKKRVLADSSVKKVTCKELVSLCIKNFRIQDTNKSGLEKENNKAEDIVLPTADEYERMLNNIFKHAGIKRSK